MPSVDGRVEAERIADRQHVLADFQFLGITPIEVGRFLAADLDHRDIGLRIGAHHLTGKFALVGEQHLDLVGLFHDMRIGDDITVCRHNDARTETVLAPFARNLELLVELVAEEMPEHRVIH